MCCVLCFFFFLRSGVDAPPPLLLRADEDVLEGDGERHLRPQRRAPRRTRRVRRRRGRLGAAQRAAGVVRGGEPRVDAVAVEVVGALGEHAHLLAVGELRQAHRARRLPGPLLRRPVLPANHRRLRH